MCPEASPPEAPARLPERAPSRLPRMSFKGLWWMVRSDLHHQGETPTCRTQCWLEGEAASWPGRKERYKTQWALCEASVGSLVFCMRIHRDKHVGHSTVTWTEMGKGWEKGSMTDVLALQNTHHSYVSAVPLRKGSEMLEATGWTQRGIQLSSEHLEKKKKIRRTRWSKCLHRYLARISLLKLGWTHYLYCTVC